MKALFTALLIMLCAWFTDSYSQDLPDTTEYETDEVIISATRTEQKIIDIPFSVKRVDQSEWTTSRKQSINEVIRNVPSVWFQPRYVNHDVRIAIRGFGTRSNTVIRGIRILLD